MPSAAKLNVIDAHVHLPLGGAAPHQWFPFTRGMPDYFRYLRDVGISTFVAFPSGGERVRKGLPDAMRRTNALMLEFWKKHPDLVIPAVRLHPGMPDESVREMEAARREGVVFIGEFVTYGNSDYTYEEPGFEEICEAADGLGMILNCHLLERDEKPFARIMQRYPKAVFVLAHLWDNATLVEAKAGLAAAHPNAMLDLSGYGVDRLGIWEYAAKVAGPGKVLWGSDYPINDPAIYLARLGTMRVAGREKKKIASGNVLRLLKERHAPLPKPPGR